MKKENQKLTEEGMIAEIGSLTARLHGSLKELQEAQAENAKLRERLMDER